MSIETVLINQGFCIPKIAKSKQTISLQNTLLDIPKCNYVPKFPADTTFYNSNGIYIKYSTPKNTDSSKFY